MAARSRKIQHDDQTRAKIQGSQLINFLQRHILEGTEVKKTQITAALGLLRKVLPDLQSIEGDMNHTLSPHEEALELLERMRASRTVNGNGDSPSQS